MRVYIRPTHLKFVKLTNDEFNYVYEAASECRRIDAEGDTIITFGSPSALFNLMNDIAATYDLEII